MSGTRSLASTTGAVVSHCALEIAAPVPLIELEVTDIPAVAIAPEDPAGFPDWRAVARPAAVA